MLRQCIEVIRLRRGGGFYIRNLSGTASVIFSEFSPVSKQIALGRVFSYKRFEAKNN